MSDIIVAAVCINAAITHKSGFLLFSLKKKKSMMKCLNV